MKNGLAALSASVAIGLAGCSDKIPDITTPNNISKPAITASAPVNEILDTTQIKVVRACSPQDLKTPLGYKDKYSEEYKEWFKGCDPEIQSIIRNSTTWKNNTKNGSDSDFQSLTFSIEEATKALQLLAKLDAEGQSIIRNSTTWKNNTKNGSYSDFQSLAYNIERVAKLMDLVKKDQNLKNKLTGGTKIVLKNKLYMYGIHSNVESAEVRVPTWQEVLDSKADLNIAIGIIQDKN